MFDLKHDRGGLIDVEFIVQYLVLGHSHDHQRLTGNLGNIALLGIAAELGLIPGDLAEQVRDAYREYRRLQHGLRLNGAHYARVAADSVADCTSGRYARCGSGCFTRWAEPCEAQHPRREKNLGFLRQPNLRLATLLLSPFPCRPSFP